MTLARPRIRIFFYTLLALAAATAAIFTSLSADRMWSDEACYASCVDTMVQTHDFISPATYPGEHYFQKPPLQMWLAAATYHLLPDPFRYRFWPAVFGVLTAGLTCVLGGLLLSPEIGLIGALLLATNNRLLYEHGMRAGTFDAALMFFVLVTVAMYASIVTTPDGRRHGWRWVTIGIVAGLAGLLKPFAGLPVLALVGVHLAVARSRGAREALPPVAAERKKALWGWALAIAVSLIVALPWYVAETLRFGGEFLHGMIGVNLIDRATVGVDPRHVKDPLFYLRAISRSSVPFFLVLPAAIFAIARCFVGARRAVWRLIAIVGVGWIVLFSLSRSKTIHYAYPAFPLLAICLAALSVSIVEYIATLVRNDEYRQRTRVGGVAGIILALLLHASFQASRHQARLAQRYEPYEMYAPLLRAFRLQAARCLAVGFDGPQPIWYGRAGLDATDQFYLRRMSYAAAATPASLLAATQSSEPTMVVVLRSAEPMVDTAALKRMGDPRFTAETPSLLTVCLNAASLLDPPVKLVQPEFAAGAVAEATLPVPARAFVTARMTLAAPPESPILCSVRFNGRVVAQNLLETHGVNALLAAPVQAKKLRWGWQKIELSFESTGRKTPIAGTVNSMQISLDPFTP